jgi:hypothetical protein
MIKALKDEITILRDRPLFRYAYLLLLCFFTTFPVSALEWSKICESTNSVTFSKDENEIFRFNINDIIKGVGPVIT